MSAFSDIVTFTRASAAWRFNSSGVLEQVPANQPRIDYDPLTLALRGLLIEEQRTNLHSYSSDIWRYGATRCSLTPNAGVAPDGTLTATRVTATGEYDPIITRQISIGSSIASKSFTYTVFINCDNTTQTIALYLYGGSLGSPEQVASKQFPAVAGWNRYTITQAFTADATSTSIVCRVDMADGVTPVAGSSMLVWGGQLEQAAFATSSILTPAAFTSRASTATYLDASGVMRTAAVNVARSAAYGYDAAGVLRPIGLLAEEQRTNLLAVSSDFTSGYGISANLTPSVGAASPISGQSYRRFTKVAPGASNPVSKTAITLSTGLNTLSVFASLVNVGQVTLRFYDSIGDAATAVLDLSTGSVVRTSGSVLAGTRAEKGPNGSWRFSVTANYTSRDTAGGGIYFYVGDVAAQGAAGDAMDLWGAQLEAGAFATSYIPTAGAQVTRAADIVTSAQATRAADVASVNTLSPWFNPDEGTILAEFTTMGKTGWPGVYSLAPDFFMYADAANKRTGISGRGSAGQLFKPVTQLQDTVIRRADSYDLQGMASAQDGAATTSNTLPQTTKATGLGLGIGGNYRLNGHLRRVRYFPRRLSNADLQALTA